MRMPLKIIVVAGARPNFMKVAPIFAELKRWRRFKPILVHTGQHYDFRMSDVFFRDLNIPKPGIFLGVGSAPHGAQTGRILGVFERVLLKEKPAMVIVVGDVNSTLAAALAAAKTGIPVAHVEAGLRSFDRSMPEESNRIIADHLSDYLFVSEPSGVINLKKEGIGRGKVFYVGNVMIDSLRANLKLIERSSITKKLGVRDSVYGVATLHRPSNVDGKQSLKEIYTIFRDITRRAPVFFPVHPRSRVKMKAHGTLGHFKKLKNLHLLPPLGYIDFMKLVKESRFVLTDSGGIQEEAMVLGIPCLTMRENTERPVTILQGTNELVGRELAKISRCLDRILAGRWKKARCPRFWDGRAAIRIAAILKKVLS